MKLTITRDVEATSTVDNEQGTIPSGTIVEYAGHLPNGTVRIIYNDRSFSINPLATKELQ